IRVGSFFLTARDMPLTIVPPVRMGTERSFSREGGRTMSRTAIRLAAAAAVFIGVARDGQASMMVNITQSGVNVLITASGPVNTAGLSVPVLASGSGTFISPSNGVLVMIDQLSLNIFSGVSGPPSFGNGGVHVTPLVLGVFGIDSSELGLPLGYVS